MSVVRELDVRFYWVVTLEMDGETPRGFGSIGELNYRGGQDRVNNMFLKLLRDKEGMEHQSHQPIRH